jgi:hypothetical protein
VILEVVGSNPTSRPNFKIKKLNTLLREWVFMWGTCTTRLCRSPFTAVIARLGERRVQEELVATGRRFAHMSDYEFYRIACDPHEGYLPSAGIMQSFWQVWCELRMREEMKGSQDLSRGCDG